MNDFEAELLLTLDLKIKSGEISITQDNSQLFKILRENFPSGFNRIAWSKIEHSEQMISDKTNPGAEAKVFIQTFLDKYKIEKKSKVIFFGDAMDIALQLDLDYFFSFANEFLTIPQHAYLLDAEFKWCFNHSFENEMFMGFFDTPNHSRSSGVSGSKSSGRENSR